MMPAFSTRPYLGIPRRLMDAHAGDCLVRDYEPLIPALNLPDPNDRHALAAAIRGRADVIVTFNRKDFPPPSLIGYGIAAQHPNEFILHLLGISEAKVLQAVRDQRRSLKNPPCTAAELLTTFEHQGLFQTVTSLRPFTDLL